jgi:hypothetical protein
MENEFIDITGEKIPLPSLKRSKRSLLEQANDLDDAARRSPQPDAYQEFLKNLQEVGHKHHTSLNYSPHWLLS